MTRTICVVTGSRAEYGLLSPLLKEIAADPRVTLQLAVTGMHLSPEFGLTVRQIEADGFVPDARVDMLLASDTPAGVASPLGLGVIGFADALDRLRPDLLVGPRRPLRDSGGGAGGDDPAHPDRPHPWRRTHGRRNRRGDPPLPDQDGASALRRREPYAKG
jgi:hypothetical protein